MTDQRKARAVRDAVSGYKRDHFHDIRPDDLAALDEFLEGIRTIAHSEVEAPVPEPVAEVEPVVAPVATVKKAKP